MLQKLIPNYALFLRVVGDADPYGSRRKNAFSVGNAVLSVPRNPVLIVVILGRCGHRPLQITPKAHGKISLLWQRRWILRSKRRRIGNKKQLFFRREQAPALLCAGIFCIVEFFGRPRRVAVKFCVFTDSRKGCPYDLHTVKTNIFGHG